MAYKRFLLAVLLVSALAFNYLTRSTPTVFVPAHTTNTPSEAVPVTGAMSTLQPAWIPPDCAGKPIATVMPATEQAVPTPVLQANKPIDTQTQLQVFDQTVQTVNSA